MMVVLVHNNQTGQLQAIFEGGDAQAALALMEQVAGQLRAQLQPLTPNNNGVPLGAPHQSVGEDVKPVAPPVIPPPPVRNIREIIYPKTPTGDITDE